MNEVLLEARDVKKHFQANKGFLNRNKSNVKAVDGINLSVRKGETLGLVGESGSGKSTLARLLLRLIEPSNGEILFEGDDICKYNAKKMKQLRRDMQIVFQDPFASLNPRWTIGKIIAEPLLANKSDINVKKKVQELLDTVGLNPEHYNRYPHEFSGGQRQRVGIARAISQNPKLIICDEAVSALDVSIQAQIINLFEDLQQEFNLTYIFIAHDLSVVRHMSNRVAVMYLGKIVEEAECEQLYTSPRHPYTKALLSAIPLPDPLEEQKRQRIVLKGDVPSPMDPPKGCAFHPRCSKADEVCSNKTPALEIDGLTNHAVSCFHPEDQNQKKREVRI
ncbi:ABC transporter ATP-binding protein [Alteribacillus sp. YIM 98480]|uniref:ABC transporter ATP-binding protein n=1 Tax=Alteribacillus sp. YIM 98480 TaxID=2606599 RepID=UPI00131C1237|nr:dipeptide ABC transporter ATP-binding protein [Alteribacillus sp. YIM 98480]